MVEAGCRRVGISILTEEMEIEMVVVGLNPGAEFCMTYPVPGLVLGGPDAKAPRQ